MSLSKIAPKIDPPPKSRLSLSKNKKKKPEEDRFRVVNDETIAGIFSENENPNTAKSYKKVDKIFTNYLQQINRQGDYWQYSIEDLDKIFGSFWFAVSPQKEGSDHYTVSSFHHIRYGLKRILQTKGREFDITTDPRFAHSQHMFKESCKELKRKGFGHVKRTDEIIPTGMELDLPFTDQFKYTKLCTPISQCFYSGNFP